MIPFPLDMFRKLLLRVQARCLLVVALGGRKLAMAEQGCSASYMGGIVDREGRRGLVPKQMRVDRGTEGGPVRLQWRHRSPPRSSASHAMRPRDGFRCRPSSDGPVCKKRPVNSEIGLELGQEHLRPGIFKASWFLLSSAEMRMDQWLPFDKACTHGEAREIASPQGNKGEECDHKTVAVGHGG